MSNNLVYILDNKVYINLTNCCTNDCIFCLRNDKDDVCGQNMRLDSENITSQDVINQLKGFEDKLKNGLTFCGYGEPTIKIEVLKDVAKYVKENYPDTYVKINTNGHGNIINKHNILPELKGIIDEFSISLNAQNEDLYDELCQPKIKNAYNEMRKFAQNSVDAGFKTTMSVVSDYKDYDIKTDECMAIAQQTGANFRAREWIKNGY